MVSSVDVAHSDVDRYEDEARMKESRYLFALSDDVEQMEEFNNRIARAVDYAFGVVIDKALRILSWDDLEDESEPVEANQKWLKALQSARSYLHLNFPSFDTSLLSKLKQTLTEYAEIRYPNLLVVIQPKLQLLNTIEA